ncbi:MAG: hypothetical protein U9R53_00565 [Chloroflexota bacterium]|nr:hypothetical protein [Chloroflexota bacterium]
MTKARLFIFFTVLGLILTSCDLLSVTETPPTKETPTLEENPKRPIDDKPPTEEAESDTPIEEQEISDKPLSDDGPWWVFSTPEGLFAINPDGSGLKQFNFDTVNSPWARQILVSPQGGYLAYLVGESFDATLKISLLPWPTLITETPLLSFSSDPDMDAMRAIVEQKSLAFSPDGRILAFMGAIDGPTSDLYIYDLDSYEITRMTDGLSQAYQPVWSPDGKYIVHTGVDTFGTGAGFSMTGIWASVVETTDAISLYDPSGSGSERIIGWVDDQTFIVYSWDPMCGMNNLRSFNIETKESAILWAESFRAIALNPLKDVVVLSSNDGTCAPGDGVGFYIVQTNGSGAFQFLDDTGPQGIWSEEAELILFLSDLTSGVIAVDSMGQYLDLDMPPGAQVFPAIAPGSRDLAWGGEALWIGPLLGSIDNPPKEIFNEPVYTVTWTPDGESVLFFADSGLYRADKPDYTPILIVEGLDNRNGYSDWVLP